MGTCFIIQPFDGGAFDKRYEDVLAPAVSAAGLEPYRVDRDPGVSIPIDEIEAGIRSSDICLAEITTDNPNVWFELGFAIASQRDVVLICSSERQSRFPFDVQHRSIITYTTDSSRDFEQLGSKITARLKAIMLKEETMARVASLSSVAEVQGLTQHEIVALVAIAENIESPDDSVSAHEVFNDMQKAGFTKVATTLALTRLLRIGMVATSYAQDYDGNRYIVYSIESDGMDWLLRNQDKLVLRKSVSNQKITSDPEVITADDVPF